MTEYQASNGIKVDSETQGITGRRRITFDHGNHGTSVEMSAEEAVALIESLDHEKDEDLGRWRWPESPDYVVYAKGETEAEPRSGVRVVHESSGRSRDIGRSIVDACESTVSTFGQAARAYFEAHPERKPWHDAKSGEIWVLTIDGSERVVSVVQQYEKDFNPISHPIYATFANGSEHITEARKIWPEDAS